MNSFSSFDCRRSLSKTQTPWVSITSPVPLWFCWDSRRGEAENDEELSLIKKNIWTSLSYVLCLCVIHKLLVFECLFFAAFYVKIIALPRPLRQNQVQQQCQILAVWYCSCNTTWTHYVTRNAGQVDRCPLDVQVFQLRAGGALDTASRSVRLERGAVLELMQALQVRLKRSCHTRFRGCALHKQSLVLQDCLHRLLSMLTDRSTDSNLRVFSPPLLRVYTTTTPLLFSSIQSPLTCLNARTTTHYPKLLQRNSGDHRSC